MDTDYDDSHDDDESYDNPIAICECGHPSQSHATGGKCEAYVHPDSECDCLMFDDTHTTEEVRKAGIRSVYQALWDHHAFRAKGQQ